MSRLKTMQGFTLVELMVALALTSFLLLGAFQVFDANFKSYNLLISDSQIQDAGRIARSIMVKDIQSADEIGCHAKHFTPEGGEIFGDGVNPAFDMNDIGGVYLQNNVSGEQPISGLVDYHISGDTSVVEEGTDVLTLARAVGLSEHVVSYKDEEIRLTGTEFRQGDYLMLKNCTEAIKTEIFQVVKKPKNNAGSQTLTLNGKVTGSYALNGKQLMSTSMYRIEAVSYFISEGVNSEDNAKRFSLFRKVNNDPAQEFIAGIDDLQVAFQETLADGKQNYSRTPADALIETSLLHVTLVVRADQTNSSGKFTGPDFGKTNGQTYPADGRLRRVVSFTGRVRS